MNSSKLVSPKIERALKKTEPWAQRMTAPFSLRTETLKINNSLFTLRKN